MSFVAPALFALAAAAAILCLRNTIREAIPAIRRLRRELRGLSVMVGTGSTRTLAGASSARVQRPILRRPELTMGTGRTSRKARRSARTPIAVNGQRRELVG